MVAAVVALTMISAPSPALAEPGAGTETVAALVVRVAEADQRLQEVGARIQGRQEGVNRAIADVQMARDRAAQTSRDVQTSQLAVRDATLAIEAAQRRFDVYAASTYIQGPSGSPLIATNPDEMIATAGAGQTLQISFEKTVADLARTRTELVNEESSARAAQQRAEDAAAQAQASMNTAVATLTDTQRQFGAQQAEVDRLVEQRKDAQARLDVVRARSTSHVPAVAGTPAQAPAVNGDDWDTAVAKPAESQWDTTLPMVPSANVAGDPIAIINTVLQISTTSAQLTANMGRQFLTKLGILSAATAAVDPGITNGRIPRVYGREASEYVIRRAMSQLGVPYSWGGGNASGPSNGIDQGAGTVGFDCSGLYLYAFAGVGIKLDHYSGSQYNAGRQIPSAQMRRGDLIFYGPNASQHEAMYLGNGQMLEAPYTGSQVRVAPVRTSGMTPYVTRLIEY
jgi:peptidoglycan DL-endopeptidase RipA